MIPFYCFTQIYWDGDTFLKYAYPTKNGLYESECFASIDLLGADIENELNCFIQDGYQGFVDRLRFRWTAPDYLKFIIEGIKNSSYSYGEVEPKFRRKIRKVLSSKKQRMNKT